MPVVNIPYSPRTWALELHNSKKRWHILVLHRRAGKTTAALNHLQKDALTTGEARFAYIAPTYKQAKQIAWDLLKRYSRMIPGIEFNEAELTARYPNGSRITLYGADNPDSLRGIGLWGVVFDEYSQQPPTVFSEVVSKSLADHLGYAIFMGTPKGKNDFYRIFNEAKGSEDWMAIFRTIDDSLEREKGTTIENLRQALQDDQNLVEQGLMSKDEFLQEWYCSFEAAIKGAYYAEEISKSREKGYILPFEPDLRRPVYSVWDLGVGQSMAVGFFQRTSFEVRMIDFLEGEPGEALPQTIARVLAKPYSYAGHFAPHDIETKDIGTGVSRKEMAQNLGVHFQVVPRLPVDDGIQAAKTMFPRLRINANTCAHFVDLLAQYRREWDEKRGMFKNNPYHDFTSHAADVLRYAAVVENLMAPGFELTDSQILDNRRERATIKDDIGV